MQTQAVKLRILQRMKTIDLEQNKTNVIAFYNFLFNDCQPRNAVERYVGDDYIQHNPDVESGTKMFVTYFERMAREFSGKHVEIKRAIAEQDLVVIHCRQSWP